MATITSLPVASTIDAVADTFPIVTNSINTTQQISRNTFLSLSSAPVGLTDVQTLTSKTLTNPTINSATLSGTISGTYTLGGTPTFPSTVVTTTGTQTLTSKTLTSPTINSPTITNATLSADTVTGYTTSNTGTVYGIPVTTGVINTAGTINGASLVASTVDNTKVATGFVVQAVNTLSNAVATGTTLIPIDDTIPQITEGDQYMTLAITPKSATNILVIQVTVYMSNSAANDLIVALFQDSTANALAAASTYQGAATGRITIPLTYTMTAGTTSSTTFRIRAGGSAAGTTTFNGFSSARVFGAITKSSIVITEYKA